MSIFIKHEALRLSYLNETGHTKPVFNSLYYEEAQYVEWLEEKVTEQLEKLKTKTSK
jgi:hypothetical protein